MKNIFIAGASGFVGQYLAKRFLLSGNSVTGIGTSKEHPFFSEYEHFEWISADTTLEGRWQKELSNADIVINLTGRNIFNYWTKKYKQSLYDSRILTTKNIVNALNKSTSLLLNASAAGYYGNCHDDILTEDQKSGKDFLARVCVDWEKEAQKASEKGVRNISMRFGIVLGKGGALGKMLPAFKMFVGGPLGSGHQWFPWIHIHDLAKAIEFLIKQEDLSGPFNFTSKESVRQKDFAKSLGRQISRPAFMPAPSFAIKLFMGELGSSLLASQKAVPERLLKNGFKFDFQNLSWALKDVLEKE